LSTEGLHRYPVNDIVEPTSCTLVIPFGHKMLRKMEVAMGYALPLKSGVLYNKKPISPDYARVNVTWTHDDYDEEEIDIPTKDNDRYIRGILGAFVLWNKEDIILDMPTPWA
jgi:hypothetical protein